MTIYESIEMAPISANFAGSMMMPAPIMLREVRSVSCVTLIFLLDICTLKMFGKSAALKTYRSSSLHGAMDVLFVYAWNM